MTLSTKRILKCSWLRIKLQFMNLKLQHHAEFVELIFRELAFIQGKVEDCGSACANRVELRVRY